MWGELTLCAFTLHIISWGISCGQDAGLTGSLAWSTTNISVWGIFLVKTKRSSRSLSCVVSIHKAKEQSPFKKRIRWWSCHSNEGVTPWFWEEYFLLCSFLSWFFLFLFQLQTPKCHQRGLYFSWVFYEIEKRVLSYFKLFCRLLDCFTAKYLEKCLLLILRNVGLGILKDS